MSIKLVNFIVSVVAIASIILRGFHLQSIVFIVLLFMFLARVYGYYASIGKLIGVEVFVMLVTILFSLVMRKFSIPFYSILFGLRALYTFLVWNECTKYIYVQKEERK